jgi:hypothetical protein
MSNQAQNLPVTSRAGSITTGGTAQDVYTEAQAPKQGFEFQNTSDTAMLLAWGTNATSTNGINVPAGGMYYRPGPDKIVPKGRMSVLCATTGKTFVCNTW